MVPSRRAAFGCDICGALMPFREIEEHKRLIHSDALATQARAMSAFARPLVLVFSISSVAMFVALFAPLNIFGIPAPNLYVVGVLAAWIGSIFVAVVYAHKTTRHLFEPLLDVLSECHVCDSKMPRRLIKDHLRERHPRELRYLRVSAFVVIGSVIGFVGGFIAFVFLSVAEVIPMADSNLVQTVLFFGLSAWAAGVVLYGLFGYPRHVERTKLAWRRGLGPS